MPVMQTPAAAAPKAGASPAIELVTEHACHGGVQRFYRHHSRSVGLPMRFSLFLPPADVFVAANGLLPALMWLAGLTCTEETFMAKAGAQRLAAELGLVLVAPDTSPRGAQVPGEADSSDFGVGAGYWLDATREPWSRHWRMESWLLELLDLLPQHFPVDPDRIGLSGHSMGGHGALTLALRHPGRFRSLSAFAPICSPMRCPWGEKAFAGYLGDGRAAWAQHDACALMARQAHPPYPQGILIDQGLADPFLASQLHPHAFELACAQVRQPLTLRRHAAYDHGYYFIKTFMEDHLRFHAQGLGVLPVQADEPAESTF